MDFGSTGEGGADCGDEARERGGVPQEVEYCCRDCEGDAVAAGCDDERAVGLQFFGRERLAGYEVLAV